MMGFGHAFPFAQSNDSRAKLAALEKVDETSSHGKGSAGPEKVKLISYQNFVKVYFVFRRERRKRGNATPDLRVDKDPDPDQGPGRASESQGIANILNPEATKK